MVLFYSIKLLETFSQLCPLHVCRVLCHLALGPMKSLFIVLHVPFFPQNIFFFFIFLLLNLIFPISPTFINLTVGNYEPNKSGNITVLWFSGALNEFKRCLKAFVFVFSSHGPAAFCLHCLSKNLFVFSMKKYLIGTSTKSSINS